MNYERFLALVMVICFIAAVVLFGTNHLWIGGVSLYVSLTSLVLLFIRGATIRSRELDELRPARR